jgi:hypothetical protein
MQQTLAQMRSDLANTIHSTHSCAVCLDAPLAWLTSLYA